jgi:glycine/D-amino acid oxidase-like deaminating enzyme
MINLDIDTDVLIVGGGIVGCSVAYYLARSGVETVLIDRLDLNTQASGTNAGSLHVQLQSYQVKAVDSERVKAFEATLPLYEEAVATWGELSEELDCDIEYQLTGGLMVAETEAQLRFLESKAARERAHGLDVQILSGSELGSLAPYLSDRVIAAEYCPKEGKVNPTLATPALVRGAERAGARFLRHTELLALHPQKREFKAETSRGRIRCARVVNASGSWSASVAAMVGIRIAVAGNPIHMNVTEPTAPLVKHLVQHVDRFLTMKQAAGGNVIVGGGWRAAVDSVTGQLRILRTSVEGNLWVAQRVVPELAHVPLMRTWAGQSIAIDGKPILGEVPRVPGFYNAVLAHSGYTAGPFFARLLADVVKGRRTAIDIETFSIQRFSTTAACP